MIWIIFKREYLNLVRKKSFLISTFLVPLGLALLFGIQIIAMLFVEKNEYKVWVISDQPDVVFDALRSTESLAFELTDLPMDSLRARVLADKSELVLQLPDTLAINKLKPDLTFTLFSADNVSTPIIEEIEDQLRQAIRSYKVERAGLSEAQLSQLEFRLDASTQKWTETGTKKTNTLLASGVGYVVGFLTYMLMAIYGSILMQGIIEEKANRIIEVIVSSVKPFNLLLGKTLAIASVGITQFLLWVVLSSVVIFTMGLLVGGAVDPEAVSQPGVDAEANQAMAVEVLGALQDFEWTILWFVPIYFLGGFFLYGSLYAAAGAAVDNVQDAQQFTLPITIPLILPLLFVFNLIQSPNGSFAVFASLFPFFSPMSMLVRMALTEVPIWQVALSIALLILTFLGCIWLAAKIYRTGILMYGKKPSFKEIFRWLRYQ